MGRDQTPDPAGLHLHLRLVGGHVPVHALKHARSAPPGLHHDRTRQGTAQPHRALQARAPQRAHAGHHHSGTVRARAHRRLGDHRVHLRPARPGPALLPGSHGARLPADHGQPGARRGPDPAGQPAGRRGLRSGRPTHPGRAREGAMKRRPLKRTSPLARHALLVLGALIVGVMSLAAMFAPLIAPFDPNFINVNALLEPPSAAHLLGTDALGRDVFSRILFGGRVSLWVGFVAVGIATGIGLVLGLVAGYFGRVVDEIIMRGVDVMLCFPSFFLILAVIAFLEPSLTNIMVVIGLTGWMGVARLVRAETLTIRERDYVLAARASGAGPGRIIFRHILPNAVTPVLVSATLGVAGAILTESSLSSWVWACNRPTPPGATCSWRARTCSASPGGCPSFPAWPSWSRCWATTCWASLCGTCSTRG
eukprot:TRINITY_DN16319_c0_g1_i1.p1 TRINITY_DN16319_c0_g1~~TRINITY_DN16319_c0_g1_i1.p1  ORF type:complete len:423 (+),score=158.98 TRINITY_DN16319_c0_g1_i1:383-1651(+)